jgi:amidase
LLFCLENELADDLLSVAGTAKVNPTPNAVVELFDDVVADPLEDGMHADGVFAGVS